jgi:hypothetical protein
LSAAKVGRHFSGPGVPGVLEQKTTILITNWLRVLGTAELPHIDQGVRHQLHTKMSLLQVFKTKKQPLECILPRKGPINAPPQRMDGGIE